MRNLVYAGLVIGALGLADCSGGSSAPAKTAGELTEAEKQQIRELDEQRAQEWGGAPKKK